VAIPRLLSLLAYHDPNAVVLGLDSVPADQVPPVNVVRVAFQLMVGIGSLLAALGVTFLVLRYVAVGCRSPDGSTARWSPPDRWPLSRCWPAGPRLKSAVSRGWCIG
jgi:cytochrome bd-type quinol oxidase subunit 1